MSTERDASKTIREPTRGGRDAASLAADLSMAGHALPAGTQLHDYVITGLLGEGGFGIVYLAEDAGLQREVAIKEYLPSSMASRAKDAMTVLVKSHNHQETFTLGLKSFVNEARLLARFDHPALVKVHRFWEANGTAYMVMPYYRGPTLKATLAELGRPPDEAELRKWLWPLMDALSVMHAAQCYHRDIAPDNILITENGPLLLDFGAARRVIGDMTQALTVVLKPGFAPIEQYGDLPGMTQGAWTDIYALASVLYTAISGRRPMPSVERLLDDRLRPLAEVAQGQFPGPFLDAIDQALALKPADRPRSVEAFRALLNRWPNVAAAADAESAESAASGPSRPSLADADVRETAPAKLRPVVAPADEQAPAAMKTAPGDRRGLLIGLALASVLVAGAGVAWLLAAPATPAPTSPPAVPTVLPGQAGSDPSAAQDRPVTPSATGSGGAVPEATSSASATSTAPPPARSLEPAASPPAATPGVSTLPPATVQVPAAPAPSASPGLPASAVRKPIVTPTTSATAPPPTVIKSPDLRSKCSDILQKASLETLSASEQAFLRKECR